MMGAPTARARDLLIFVSGSATFFRVKTDFAFILRIPGKVLWLFNNLFLVSQSNLIVNYLLYKQPLHRNPNLLLRCSLIFRRYAIPPTRLRSWSKCRSTVSSCRSPAPTFLLLHHQFQEHVSFLSISILFLFLCLCQNPFFFKKQQFLLVLLWVDSFLRLRQNSRLSRTPLRAVRSVEAACASALFSLRSTMQLRHLTSGRVTIRFSKNWHTCWPHSKLRQLNKNSRAQFESLCFFLVDF